MDWKTICRSGIILTTSLLATALVESDAGAKSGVLGYSGKAFYPTSRGCFLNGAGTGYPGSAWNTCSTNALWAIYPITSDQFTGSNHTMNVRVHAALSPPYTAVNCRLDIYSNGLVSTTPWVSGATGTVSFTGLTLGYSYVPELVCDVPSGGMVLNVTIDT